MDIKHYYLYFDEGEAEPQAPSQPEQQTQPEENGQTPQPTDIKKYSDAELDAIINRKFARWQQQQQEAIDEATRLANMNAQERAEAERDKLQKELEQLKHANMIADMERQARQMLIADNISVPDDILHVLVRDDAEATSSAVKLFSQMYKSSVQDAVTQQLSHKAPIVGTSPGQLSKADIMAVKDPIKRQQLIKENMHLF